MSFLKMHISAALRSAHIFRPIHISTVSRRCAGFEEHAATRITILNQKNPYKKNMKMIDAHSELGFRLIDDSFIFGPMLIFEDYVFCWNIKGDDEINEASLQFLFHLHPALDLIIIGYGHPECSKDIFGRNLHLAARKHNCAIEILPTDKAIGTYNFLVKTRHVAGAFVPPAVVRPSEKELIHSKMSAPCDLDFPSVDSEHYFDMLDLPRYKRVQTKVLKSKKEKQEQIASKPKSSEIEAKKEEEKDKKD